MASFAVRYLYEDTDRHGKLRRYFRKRGCRKTRLRADPVTQPAEFQAEYAAALAANGTGFLPAKVARNTGTIYFIGFGERVKIGFTINLSDRLRTLQTSCPEPLITST
jgi:hypothetical protein